MMDNLEPNVDDRKKFDIDLTYGKVREKQIADMLQNKKIEVKSERGMWMKTGNIAIEYMCSGKPSGIQSTEADYWFHNLCIGDDTYATLVFKTDNLRQILNNMKGKRQVYGGDNNAAQMFLVNLQSLFSRDNINAYSDRSNK
mgnify:FL=1